MTKAISADDRLKFIGLMTLAAEHIREARKIDLAMHRLLGEQDGSLISDAVWGSLDGPDTSIAAIDDLLSRMGFATN